jgi:hypothetical protein
MKRLNDTLLPLVLILALTSCVTGYHKLVSQSAPRHKENVIA